MSGSAGSVVTVDNGDGAVDATRASPVSCSWCGRGADAESTPLGWSTQASEQGTQTLCEPCTRVNVRSIEAKLDSEWW